MEDAGVGEQFMAIIPCKQVVDTEPTHGPVDPSEPDVKLELEYVYGYRSEDSRQNVHYTVDGKICYMTAALGVILDQSTNTQAFFGGKQVDSKRKQNIDPARCGCHTDDILALKLSKDRKKAVSGQVGSQPRVLIWNTTGTPSMERCIKLGKVRGISAVAWSNDNKYVAMADLHNDHNVYVYEASTGNLVYNAKGGTEKVLDMAFSQKPGEHVLGYCGKGFVK